MHKRRNICILAITVLAVILLSSCNNVTLSNRTYRDNNGEFSVHYLDVGQGDCALVYFPDGKTMIIDAGNDDKQNYEYVIEFLRKFGVQTIDYLVLTHPDEDHIGGVTTLINEFEIGTAYVSHIVDKDNFPSYKKIVEILTAKGAVQKESCTYQYIKDADYVVAFLTPYPHDFSSSSYNMINAQYPTESDINNVSPIIYVEYKGIRFLFTGDAGAWQENQLLSDELAIIKPFEDLGIFVNLDSIDFLKVAHHGSADSTTEQFIKRITPKNAVISVGGLNVYGHPSSQVLYRLTEFSPAHNLFRTDVLGTISVIVSSNAKVSVATD